MLAYFRSRDLRQVSAAAEWFCGIDVRRTIDNLVLQLDSDDPLRRSEVKRVLAAFSELSFKRVLDLLDDADRFTDAVEILAQMDGHIVQHLIRQLDRPATFNLKVGILASLAGHLEYPDALSALSTGLRDPDPLVQAVVCQALLEQGPRGHQVLERVFPGRNAIAA